jgi:alpha-glucosidase (family GH31 glycosyl hydrolase)
MDVWNDLTVGLRNQSYKPIPIFHSSKGYMIFDNSSYRLRADIGNAQPDQYRISQFGPIFDYYIWVNSPEQALQSYTSLTGKPILPPKWAFEPWMGRTGRSWTNDAPDHDPAAEQMRVVKKFAELDIPHSAIYAEGSTANTPAVHSFMAPRGIKVLSWYFPAISPREQKKLMPEYKTEDLPVLKTDTTIPNKVIDYVDFTNPLAKEVSKRWWKLRLDLGVAGSMIDFGDRVPEDAVFYDGRKGAEMHNFMSYDYHRIYSEVFRDRRGDDYILFGRAAAPGTQKFAAQFSGDVRANFVGLYGGMKGVLNLSSCGFSTWGSDLGGFRAWAEPEVYMRWTQFACFSPLMRCHGRTPREPWNFSENAVSNYKHYAWVRENLLNYIYNAAARAHEKGIPMMRSMAVAFPDQTALSAIDDQYMFGRDLLVAPVVSDSYSRSISFPAGKWIDLWSGKAQSGSATVQYDAPQNIIPVFMKEGSAIPVRLNSNLKFGDSMTGNQVGALIVTAPKDKEEIPLLNDQNNAASVSMQDNANSFNVQMNNLPEMTYLIVYDSSVSGVKIEGKSIPQLNQEEQVTLPIGWYKDSSLNRIIVRLPRGIKTEVEIVK